MSGIKLVKKHKCFDGSVEFYQHSSLVNNSQMNFSVFVPPQAKSQSVPTLYWLSGLTCTEENFMVKAGIQRLASQLGIFIVAPDTSSRNNGIEGEDDSYDFGSGAGFYVNATEEKWSKNYNMYDYITRELPELVEENFSFISTKKSIFGHSMGGHGALVVGLKNSMDYCSVSAFSPIVNPMESPWGRKAFAGYLGEDRKSWEAYDATQLVSRCERKISLFVDQGLEDEFLKDQLMPENLEKVCREADHPLELRKHSGYDHSYYFISTFLEDHMKFHKRHLSNS